MCGKPPFETSSLKETYSRIKKNEYTIPPSRKLSDAACVMIHKMLRNDPTSRPTMAALRDDPWLREGAYMFKNTWFFVQLLELRTWFNV